MRTRKMTRVSFSDKLRQLDISLPRSWQELSQEELLTVMRLKTVVQGTREHLKLMVFRSLTRMRVIRKDADRFRVSFRTREAGPVIAGVSPEAMANMLEPLDFIFTPGNIPVRLEKWHGAEAVDAGLHGVSFSNYIMLENTYQGFLSSGNDGALYAMAAILYPGVRRRHIDDVFRLNLLQWVVQLKALFAANWPNLFRPAPGAHELPSMLEIMNNEIRVLTGGDVSKEKDILNIDCWRALTELDFKAREAEEYRRLHNK